MLLGNRFWHDEQFTELAIHTLCDIAGKFKVLRLIVANGHVLRVIEQDIACHEDWVVEQANTHCTRIVQKLHSCFAGFSINNIQRPRLF